ncbi:MAG: hypothetical protein AAB308_03860, partial [Nitrospirota bacterium]
QTMEKQLTQVKAGILLGLAHRGRGMPSSWRLPAKVKATALRLYAQRDGDFGLTLAAEQLAECHGLTVSDETLRSWLLAKGVAHFQRRQRPHRARTAHVGELVQLNGAPYDWFEGRGSRCVLMASIDDASSRGYVRFYDYDGTSRWPG